MYEITSLKQLGDICTGIGIYEMSGICKAKDTKKVTNNKNCT